MAKAKGKSQKNNTSIKLTRFFYCYESKADEQRIELKTISVIGASAFENDAVFAREHGYKCFEGGLNG